MQLSKRHVFYFSGYDARGDQGYYDLFKTEIGASAKLWNYSAIVGPLERRAGNVSSIWNVVTAAPNWRLETTYEFTRWEDIVREDLKRPLWRLVPCSAFIFLEALFNGVIIRYFRTAHPYAFFYCYAFFISSIFLTLGILTGILTARYFRGVPGIAAGAVVCAAVYWTLMRFPGRPWFVRLLLNDWGMIRDFAVGRAKKLDARHDETAARIVEAVRDTDADEIIFVGHSSGTFHVFDALGRALERDPDLAKRVPINVLTVGASIQFAGFYPGATKLRERIAAVAKNPDIYWSEFQSRQDLMNFHRTNPVEDLGIATKGELANPRIRRFHFTEMLNPETLKRIRSHHFRLHFQFIMAPEKRTPFDYFMITCGPLAFRDRIESPPAALAAFAADGALHEVRADTA